MILTFNMAEGKISDGKQEWTLDSFKDKSIPNIMDKDKVISTFTNIEKINYINCDCSAHFGRWRQLFDILYEWTKINSRLFWYATGIDIMEDGSIFFKKMTGKLINMGQKIYKIGDNFEKLVKIINNQDQEIHCDKNIIITLSERCLPNRTNIKAKQMFDFINAKIEELKKQCPNTTFIVNIPKPDRFSFWC